MRYAQGSKGQSPEQGIARTMSEFARQLQAEDDFQSLLRCVTDAAVDAIGGAQYAGISEITSGGIETRAATNALVEDIDRLQYNTDGPCVTSLRQQVTVRSHDLEHDERWPVFGPAAREKDVRSMLSVQLFVAEDNLGALNLYSTEPDSFDDEDESTAMLLAAHAAVAMSANNAQAHLRIALTGRDIIGQAKGILMERFKINADQAFALLVQTSQHVHRKLRDVAEEIATTGELRDPR